MNQQTPTLDVRNVSHQYSKGSSQVKALVDVSISVNPSELVSIKGASGSGKTTLLLACGGMLSPSQGSIMIDGMDLYKLSASARNSLRASHLGYVFQTLQLLPYLTVLENVTLHSRSIRQEATEWLERFELADRIKHRPVELSHGQRQRVAIIRAIVHQPKLLIADEPTGNLDEKNAKLVFEILRHFANSGGAVLVASHDHGVDEYSDRRFEIENKSLSEITQTTKQAIGSEVPTASSPNSEAV